jgi:hypothetical protein
MEEEKIDRFFSKLTFYNPNLEKHFKGYEKNYQFGFIKREWGDKDTCIIVNDNEGYFRGIIIFSGDYPNHIYTQEGKDIGSHCWDHQLCSIEEDGPRQDENGIEFLLRKTEQIREEKYKIR